MEIWGVNDTMRRHANGHCVESRCRDVGHLVGLAKHNREWPGPEARGQLRCIAWKPEAKPRDHLARLPQRPLHVARADRLRDRVSAICDDWISNKSIDAALDDLGAWSLPFRDDDHRRLADGGLRQALANFDRARPLVLGQAARALRLQLVSDGADMYRLRVTAVKTPDFGPPGAPSELTMRDAHSLVLGTMAAFGLVWNLRSVPAAEWMRRTSTA